MDIYKKLINEVSNWKSELSKKAYVQCIYVPEGKSGKFWFIITECDKTPKGNPTFDAYKQICDMIKMYVKDAKYHKGMNIDCGYYGNELFIFWE